MAGRRTSTRDKYRRARKIMLAVMRRTWPYSRDIGRRGESIIAFSPACRQVIARRRCEALFIRALMALGAHMSVAMWFSALSIFIGFRRLGKRKPSRARLMMARMIDAGKMGFCGGGAAGRGCCWLGAIISPHFPSVKMIIACPKRAVLSTPAPTPITARADHLLMGIGRHATFYIASRFS